jgi:4-hydroxybenzoate polyprenyltransferase
LLILWQALTGKILLKQTSSLHIPFYLLPYHLSCLNYLKAQKKLGRYLVLVTQAPHAIAQAIKDQLEIFDEAWGSEEFLLVGQKRSQFLQQKFEKSGFAYLGSHHSDIPVWQHAQEVLIAKPSSTIVSQLSYRNIHVAEILHHQSHAFWRECLRLFRVRHWIKNSLIALPAILAKKLDTHALFTLALYILAFSLAVSATYVINDTLDLDQDRAHPSKKNRPLAKGSISLKTALFMSVVALVFGSTLALYVAGMPGCLWIWFYIVSTLTYSLYCKPIVLIDIIFLCGLYLLRILAGANILLIEVSQWFLGFSLAFFMSLSLTKRCTELQKSLDKQIHIRSKRGYITDDLPYLKTLGTSLMVVSCLILALYIQSQFSSHHYHHPQYLWGIVLLLFYWFSRVWLLCSRKTLDDDPILFVYKDPVSQWTLFLGTLNFLWAAYG